MEWLIFIAVVVGLVIWLVIGLNSAKEEEQSQRKEANKKANKALNDAVLAKKEHQPEMRFASDPDKIIKFFEDDHNQIEVYGCHRGQHHGLKYGFYLYGLRVTLIDLSNDDRLLLVLSALNKAHFWQRHKDLQEHSSSESKINSAWEDYIAKEWGYTNLVWQLAGTNKAAHVFEIGENLVENSDFSDHFGRADLTVLNNLTKEGVADFNPIMYLRNEIRHNVLEGISQGYELDSYGQAMHDIIGENPSWMSLTEAAQLE